MTWWVAEPFGRGGIARYAVDVGLLLTQAGHATVVATTPQGPAPGWDGTHEIWFPVGRGITGRVAGAATGLLRAAQRPSRGDAVWLPLGIRPTFEYAMVAAARRSGAVVVATLHNRGPHHREGASRLVVRAAHRAAAVIVHTAALEGWARDHGLPVTRLPFPPPRIDVRDHERRLTRAALEIPDGHVVLLMFGNLSPYKGWDALLRGFAQAGAGQVPVTLILAGQARGPEPLDQARRLGVAAHVRRLPGYVTDSDLDDLLELADAVALPYAAIDHSGAGALAASRGLPAIASDLPTLRELFGDAAVYVPPGDIEALARAIRSLPHDLARLRTAAANTSVAVSLQEPYAELANRLTS